MGSSPVGSAILQCPEEWLPHSFFSHSAFSTKSRKVFLDKVFPSSPPVRCACGLRGNLPFLPPMIPADLMHGYDCDASDDDLAGWSGGTDGRVAEIQA